jgi:MFS family permease
LSCALLAIGMGFNTPSIQALISKLSHADEQGSVLGVSQSMGSLARIVGPVSGGYVYDHFGIVAPYFVASGIMLIAFVISLASQARLKPAST